MQLERMGAEAVLNKRNLPEEGLVDLIAGQVHDLLRAYHRERGDLFQVQVSVTDFPDISAQEPEPYAVRVRLDGYKRR